MHYKLKHEQYEQNHRKYLEKKGKTEEKQETKTACKKFADICCFPGFWILIIILGLVFGLFFVIVARDKYGGTTDWRTINNATLSAMGQPDKSQKAVNTTVIDKIMDIGSSHKLYTARLHQNLALDQKKHDLNQQVRHSLKSVHKNLKND